MKSETTGVINAIWIMFIFLMTIKEKWHSRKLRKDWVRMKTVHDFKFCKCSAVAVDGGHDYLRRCGNREDWEEMSVMRDKQILLM